MALQRWTILGQSTVFENPWWKYRRDDVIFPNASRGEYHYVETRGSVMIVPRTEQGEFLLVRQYRHLNRRESIEFPAGGRKEGQGWEDAARAELLEEANMEAGTLQPLGSFNPFNGVTSEISRVYLASDLRAAEGTPDPTEEFELLVLNAMEINALIAAGELWDGMSLAAWSLYNVLGRQRGSAPTETER
ncbi:MAG TPA: NUDIX hydrolase [Bacteroidota bacterium]|nr:NUDIX hydrolase [Bacteroidota bacterium]